MQLFIKKIAFLHVNRKVNGCFPKEMLILSQYIEVIHLQVDKSKEIFQGRSETVAKTERRVAMGGTLTVNGEF